MVHHNHTLLQIELITQYIVSVHVHVLLSRQDLCFVMVVLLYIVNDSNMSDLWHTHMHNFCSNLVIYIGLSMFCTIIGTYEMPLFRVIFIKSRKSMSCNSTVLVIYLRIPSSTDWHARYYYIERVNI